MTVTFRLLALSHQIRVLDAAGVESGYLETQPADYAKVVTVYSDSSRAESIYLIHFDRFGKHHRFSYADKGEFGFAGRGESPEASRFFIGVGEKVVLEVNEESWISSWAYALANWPVVRHVTGSLLAPRFLVTRPDGAVVSVITKRPIFLGTRYVAELAGQISGEEQESLLLFMITLSAFDRYQRPWLRP